MSEVLWTELEKIDILRERMGIGYEEARVALSLAQGDVVKALADLETAEDDKDGERDWTGQSHEVWNSVKVKLGRFNHTTISLKKQDKTVLSVSAPLGLALAYTVWRKPGLRMLALIGAASAAMNHYELEVASMEEIPYENGPLAYNFDEPIEEF